MREILVVNPRKKTAGRSGRKVKTMAKAKRGKKRAGKKPAKRRKNPRKKRGGYGKRAAKRLTSGLSIRSALKDQIPIQLGMLAAQWTAKRFGPDASELDPTTWGWSSYAKGVAGGFAAGMIANAIRPGLGQKVLTGALAHITHRLVRNKLIEMNPTLISQFGADEEGLYIDDDGTPYAASGGEYLPLDEEHRMLPSGSVMGGTIVPATRLGQLEPVGPLGQGDFSEYARVYR